MPVHQRLNAGRAITLCWMANRPSSPRSISRAVVNGTSRTESIDFGTHRLPTKPMAYRYVAKNTA
jgi:hypothetical protein